MAVLQLSFEEKYQALVDRDATYEGIFFAAVKTTGIFCLPTCPARKPKPENVEFFESVKEALDLGYRPCLRCKPLAATTELPSWWAPIQQRLQDLPSEKVKDYHLREMQINPAQVRRWFKKHHGLTFQAYQRSMRLNRAFGTLRDGGKVSDAAFATGYESLSGFHEAFKNKLGFPPSSVVEERDVIVVKRLLTPLGPMLAGATTEGICLLEFADRRMLETQISRLRKYFKLPLMPGTNNLLDELAKELQDYFEGNLRTFKVPLQHPGTDFQKTVWKELREVPYGSTISYLTLARKIGRIKAVRAVANANGDNRMALLIPCHRIIGADGQLRGYGGGVWRKEWLIRHERGG